MKKVLVSVFAVGALAVAGASPAFAGQVYGNYGQGYGAPSYGPAPGYDPYRAGPPAYAYGGRGHRNCEGDRVAGTIIGGVLGGIIGNNVGRGHRHHHWHGHRHGGRGPATVAGVILGGIAGNAIAGGACRDRSDRHYAPGPYGNANYGYAGPRYEPQYDDDYGPQGYGPQQGDGPQYDEGYDEGYDPDAPYSPYR